MTRPVSLSDLRKALLEADRRGVATLAPGDQMLLERLRHQAGVDTGSSEDRTTLEGGNLGLAYGVHRSYVSLTGTEGFDRGWGVGWGVDSPTAGLRLGEQSAFFLGRERLGWGPGGEGGLLFSDAAGPFDKLQYSTTWRSVRYTKLVGWLDGGRSLAAARADWMANPNLRIGFSESVVMQGGPYWVYILQPVPILVNQIVGWVLRAQQQGIDDNYFGTIDIDWIPRTGLRLFGELLIDDITLPPNPYPSRWGATLGIQSVHPGGRSLLLQYTIIPNWTYSATNSGLHYLLRGLPLGHPLGADFDALRFNWRPSPDRPLRVWMTYIRKGEGEVGRIWADLTEATTYAFLRGVVEYSTILGLDVEIQGEQGPVGTVSPWIRHRENAGHVAGQAETDWGVGLSFQWSF